MAVFFVNSSTSLNATELNKVIVGDTYTSGNYMVLSYEIYYDGAAWQVSSSMGSKQSVAGVSPAWNAGDNRLDITLSTTRAFTGNPAVLVSAKAGSSHASGLRYQPQAHATSTTAVVVRFIDVASPANYVTTEGTKMAFNIILYGAVN